METIVNKYFEPVYDFVTDELEATLPQESMDNLMAILQRIENRLTIEIELREFVCEKLAKVIHDGKL
ncbi:MAG: hypothetical protein LCH91_15565 [Bacteroidetes bacterium]|nr:hypothetical protein [Bacteroidota bacterium]